MKRNAPLPIHSLSRCTKKKKINERMRALEARLRSAGERLRREKREIQIGNALLHTVHYSLPSFHGFEAASDNR